MRELRVGLLGAALLLGCNLDATGLGGVTSSGSSASTTGSTGVTDQPTTADGTASGGGSTGTTTTADTTSVGSSDSGDSSSSSSSTGEPEPEPWPQGQFDPPVPVEMLNTDLWNDDDPSLTDDQLEIVFSSNRAASDDIFWSSRASVFDDWDPPVALGDGINGPTIENTPELSGDGLVLTFGSSRPDVVGDLDVYISYRETRADSWSLPQLVGGLSSAFEDLAPTLSLGFEEIYVCTTRPRDAANANIFRASVTQNAGALVFGGLQAVPELNSDFADCNTFVSPDLRTIFFDTSRDDNLLDLYVATRDEPGQPFEDLQPVDELNEPFAYDGDPWLSSDGQVIYFSSTRANGLQDIYYAVR